MPDAESVVDKNLRVDPNLFRACLATASSSRGEHGESATRVAGGLTAIWIRNLRFEIEIRNPSNLKYPILRLEIDVRREVSRDVRWRLSLDYLK